MFNGRWQLYVGAVLVVGVLFLGGISTAYAVTDMSSSPNYKSSQLQFGSSSTDKACSTTYCANSGVGGGISGNSSSASYVTKFGPVTGSDPFVEVIVERGVSDLGTFSSSETSTSVLGVKVRNHLSSGYKIQLVGNPPKTATHTIKAITSPGASVAGTEQFGINVVANTIPAVGLDPVQVPSDQTSFGKVSANYAVSNSFMYKSGDVIATSNKSSGQTDYTISMIVNISNTTPAGRYASDFSVVVIPTY